MFRNINILETCTIFEANLKAGHQTCKRYLTMFDSWDMCLQRSLLIGKGIFMPVDEGFADKHPNFSERHFF